MSDKEKDQLIILIASGQRKQCPQCQANMLFPRNVQDTDLPVKIACPYCQWWYLLDRPTDRNFLHFPRVDHAIPTRGAWFLSTGNSPSKDPVATPGEIIDELTKVPEELRRRSYREKADELMAMTLSTMRLAEHMRKELEDFKSTFQHDMELYYDHAHDFRTGWSPDFLHEFMDHPYLLLPLEAGIECRLLLCPKFYRRLHGTPLCYQGGFYFQLLTPYYLMGNHLDEWSNFLFQIPQLHLQVLGQKIVGIDVAKVVDQIPGCITDDDHTEFNPSIRMTRENHRQTRQWLANRGVSAWPLLPTEPDAVFPYQVQEIVEQFDTAYAKFQRTFLQQGRVCLLSEDKTLAIQRMKALASCYKSPSLIILDDPKNREEWIAKDAPQGDRWTQRLVWHGYQEFRSCQGWEDFGLVIVDTDQVPIEFLEFLYQWPGRLLLYSSDCILDSLEGNARSQALFGLTVSSCFLQNFQWKEAFWKKHKHEKGTLVEGALRTLLGNQLNPDA